VRVFSGNAAPGPVTVTVSPASASIAPGTAVQFAATVTGTPNTSVVWSATGGSISSSGRYTAGQTSGTFKVTATIQGGSFNGAAAVTIASSGGNYIDILPGQNIQSQIDSFPNGTAFRLKSGTHRLSAPLVPRSSDTFIGESGTIVSGARVLSGFTASGSSWVIGNQTQQGPTQGVCAAGYPRCANPEDLFIDGVMRRHVAALSDVGPGKWFFDYANDRIYIGDDPNGHLVETSVVFAAFTGSATGVTIAGLIIEKFANPAQAGAVAGDNTSSWTVDGNEVRFNHGIGIRTGNAIKVTRNNVHDNGELGIGGNGDGVLVDSNTIAQNNVAGFDYGWEGGGTKFVKTRNLVLRNNYAHHNTGPGLWLDIDNIDFTIEGNTSEDNNGTLAAAPGIMIEISYGGVIRNNTVRRNGLSFPDWVWGSGILVSASGGSGLEIYGNTVEDNADGITLAQQTRGSGAYGAYLVQNVHVYDNKIKMSDGLTGAAQDNGDTGIFTSRGNRFSNNTYYLGSGQYYWAWMNGERTETEWRSYGEDTTGLFIR
jgi:hypothetical protein